ncbi:hypothetical protein ASC99_20175 [Kitasatospora sp. Root107]|nr:hypothetical protein ASC99_20175 [Kitasatospora sp. Root107]
MRSATISFLRSPRGLSLWSAIEQDGGQRWVAPAAWDTLPAPQRLQRILAAEERRLTAGSAFGLDETVVAAARAVAEQRSLVLPFTEAVLPSAAGILTSQVPLHDLSNGVVIAATWGPALEGFAPGVHLTWWAAGPSADLPITPEFDLHLPFMPVIDSRLLNGELPAHLEYSALPLRTIVAAWYALSSGDLEVREERATPTIGRLLAQQKAKNRAVNVTHGASVEAVHRSILGRVAAQQAWCEEQFDGISGGLDEQGSPPRSVPFGPFDPALDPVLDAERAYMAGLYRDAATRTHRLERSISQVYPGVFTFLEEERVREFGRWPSWCWVPSHVVAHILNRQFGATEDQAVHDAVRIAAVGAWRSGGRHVVLPDHRTAPHTADDPMPVDLPGTLPVPGIGMLFPQPGAEAHLLLAHLDADGASPTGKIAIVDDSGDLLPDFRALTHMSLFLAPGTLVHALKATMAYYDDADRRAGKEALPDATEEEYRQHADLLGNFTERLTAVASPDAVFLDVSQAAANGAPVVWPPQPSGHPEIVLWMPGTPV